MKLPLILEQNSTRVYDSNNEFIMQFEKYPQKDIEHVVRCINKEIKILFELEYVDGHIASFSNKIALIILPTILKNKNERLREDRAEFIINRISIK